MPRTIHASVSLNREKLALLTRMLFFSNQVSGVSLPATDIAQKAEYWASSIPVKPEMKPNTAPSDKKLRVNAE